MQLNLIKNLILIEFMNKVIYFFMGETGFEWRSHLIRRNRTQIPPIIHGVYLCFHVKSVASVFWSNLWDSAKKWNNVLYQDLNGSEGLMDSKKLIFNGLHPFDIHNHCALTIKKVGIRYSQRRVVLNDLPL